MSALAIRLSDSEMTSVQESSQRESQLANAAKMLAGALTQIESRQRRKRRIEELSAILKAAAEWQQLDDDESLLRRIADTATELLDCERSSIFLWDKRRRKLIGRPALGIEGGALEVDDNAGVVGEVLRTGEAKIWTSGSDDEARINRAVDESLEFETRSLVAVPMSGSRDELIGVFEAINHRDGEFDAFDAQVLNDLTTHAATAIESLRTRKDLAKTRDRLVDDAASSTPLIGDHASINEVRQRALKIAKTDLSVLVLGENGTGKEVLARQVHYESQRRNGPFVAVNCAALVETLLESELFGHEKGAFTDANQTRAGKFELANGGTLFLDEVGDMSLGGQAKLLRVLEDKVVVRVGGSQPIPVDVRVIAATNQPLEELIEQKRFREDLFFRLNVVSLTLPPLSQRGEDVIRLTEHFMEQFCYQIGRQVPKLQPGAVAALRQHNWPGNIRELRNTVERICYLCSEDLVEVEDLMLSGSGRSGASGGRKVFADALTEATKEFQVEHIGRAIDACQGNMTDAAAMLGLHRSNLYRKMRQLEMSTASET
jgi:DNA-binding NtrC family response regulator